VRKYERWGFLPPSERGPSGHRLYRARHLEAIRTARAMIAGYGWMPALRIMRLFHQGAANQALAAVDACHAALHVERLKLEETLRALRIAAADSEQGSSAKGPPVRRGLLRVSEAAGRAGVRVSALRFWEEQGLLHPQRDPQSGYRLYDQEEVRRLQVVVLLRSVNYGFEEIRAVLGELAAGRLE
jgi:DNA-binding transcriptional MerR regulator